MATEFREEVVAYAGLRVVKGTVRLPAGALDDDAIAAAADIAHGKLQQRRAFDYAQAPGSAVVAATIDKHICRADGAILAVEAAITGALADDASRHVYVDLHKSTSGGAFATVLSAPIDLTSSSTIRTVYSGTISADDLVDNDLLRVVVTVAGGAGNQAQGLLCVVTLYEEAP